MDRRGMAHRAKLIPGDGVGPEVCAAARRVLGGSGVDIERDVCGAGDAAERNTGRACLLPRWIRSVTGVALEGPV